jgi:hypothetical protein
MLSKRPAQQPHLGGPAEFSFNIVAGSRRGKTTTAHQLVFANATLVPRSISRSLARLRNINAMAFQGLSYRRPLAPHRHYHRSQVAPARGNLSARVGLVALRTPVLCAPTMEATRKADEHRPGKNYLAQIRRRLEHREPGRVASLILFSLSL